MSEPHSLGGLSDTENEEFEGERESEDQFWLDEEGEFQYYLKKYGTEEEEYSDYSYDDEEEEDEESIALSQTSRVLREISFIWEDDVYIFEELCDPGNIETIFKPVPKRADYFDETGTDQYLEVCNSLYIAPMIRILRSLKTDEVDLSFRNIDKNSVRALCAALEVNYIVSKLKLRYNILTPTECSYIGYVLMYNEKIALLDLTGCRIGPEGCALLIAFLGKNLTLESLILAKCNIQDEGMKELSVVLNKNNGIKKLDLSYNNLGDDSADALATAFKTNSSVNDLNLCYNNLYDPSAMKPFYMSLSNNQFIQRLNLAWNGLSGVDTASLIGKFLKKNQSLRHLDLSDNRFQGLAVLEIKKAVAKAKSLETLKIGKNPLSPEDLDILLSGVKANPSVKVLDLEDLWVQKSFLKILNKIAQEREIKVNYAGVFSNYELKGPDYAAVILKRAQYEAQKPKRERQRKDFGHLMWNLGNEPLTQAAFMELVQKFKAKVNKQLYPELLKQFTNPKTQLVDVVEMRNKYLSLFPDSKPPPTKPKKKKSVDETAVKKGKRKKKKQAEEDFEEEMTEFAGEEEDEFEIGDTEEIIQEVIAEHPKEEVVVDLTETGPEVDEEHEEEAVDEYHDSDDV